MLRYDRLLENQRVFVTTGARGIGKDIALLFAKHGARVCVGGRTEEFLKDTAEELKAIHPDCRGYVVDLSQGDQTEKVCEQILEEWHGIDILVNTVGINQHMPAHQYTDELMEKLLECNYKSGLRCARKFLPGMAERRHGNIINISSIHSMMTMPGYMMYAGTKGAMNAAARAMALDYAGKGIRVNTICPGLILSDNMMDEVETYPEGPERERFMEMLRNMQPLAPGTMEDVSNAALFLASEMSAYTTGQIIMVDGGASIKAH